MKDPALPSSHRELAGNAQPPTVAELYLRHGKFVACSLRRFKVHESSMDDAIQDVFLVVHRRLADFNGRSAIKTWLFAIARWVAQSHRRSLKRRSQHVIDAPTEQVDETPTLLDGPLEQTARREALAILQAVLQRFDTQKRALFVMVELEQMTLRAAATAQGINMNTAHARLRAAWATLENQMGRAQKDLHPATHFKEVSR